MPRNMEQRLGHFYLIDVYTTFEMLNVLLFQEKTIAVLNFSKNFDLTFYGTRDFPRYSTPPPPPYCTLYASR